MHVLRLFSFSRVEVTGLVPCGPPGGKDRVQYVLCFCILCFCLVCFVFLCFVFSVVVLVFCISIVTCLFPPGGKGCVQYVFNLCVF